MLNRCQLPKNLIFFTQSNSLDTFYNIYLSLKDNIDLGKVGFYVTDSKYFSSYPHKFDLENDENIFLLKEWEIIRKSHGKTGDLKIIKSYEDSFSESTLWNAIASDRRIFYGKRYASRQDYKPRYNYDQMTSILTNALVDIDEFINKVNPDLIITFISVTIGDYLANLFSKLRSITYVNLRPTKIKNYIFASENLISPSKFIIDKYKQYMEGSITNNHIEESENYIKQIKRKHTLYEGSIPPSSNVPSVRKSRKSPLEKLFQPLKILLDEIKYQNSEMKYDNHHYGVIAPMVQKLLFKPLRSSIANNYLGKIFLETNELKKLNYAFYPMSVEPEFAFTLNIGYQNQIELIRSIAKSLPFDMKLVVKEHPVSVGKRTIAYYKKILEIPNVCFANTSLTSREVLLNAKIVFTLTPLSAIAFEAMVLERPVIFLSGGAPFEFLPENMVINVRDNFYFGDITAKLLKNFKYDENAVIAYISAVINESIDVDFFSVLLNKHGAFREGTSLPDDQYFIEYNKNIKKLSNYLLERYSLYKKSAS